MYFPFFSGLMTGYDLQCAGDSTKDEYDGDSCDAITSSGTGVDNGGDDAADLADATDDDVIAHTDRAASSEFF